MVDTSVDCDTELIITKNRQNTNINEECIVDGIHLIFIVVQMN